MNLRLVLLLPLATGCGGDLCARPSPCAHDPMPTETQLRECHAMLDKAAKCYAEVVASRQCQQASIVCTADGGITDVAATQSKASRDCAPQNNALNGCCLQNADSPACR